MTQEEKQEQTMMIEGKTSGTITTVVMPLGTVPSGRAVLLTGHVHDAALSNSITDDEVAALRF